METIVRQKGSLRCQGLLMVIERAAGPKQFQEDQARLLPFARDDNEINERPWARCASVDTIGRQC